jgi:hypothetical protein
MGTLFEQKPRTDSIDCYFSVIWEALERMGVDSRKNPTPDQVMAACRVVEVSLKIQSADVLDEQLGGFGELARGLVAAFEAVANSIANLNETADKEI